MQQSLNDMAVVITGTSSGIGKATAVAFAQRGARVAMCARRRRQLDETAAACREAGAQVVSVLADVADEQQVKDLAARAIDAFGRVDVWINNAGLDAFGAFEEIPTEAFDRVIQVNLLGTVHGARAILPHFRARRSGVLINHASMVGACPTPFHSAYVAAKFAIRGFSFALRQELMEEPGIHVCVVSSASIDTPLWQRSANFTGRKIKPLDPVYPPEQAAAAMVDLALRPEREVFPGAAGWTLAEQYAASPGLTEGIMAWFTRYSLFQDGGAERADNALFEPEDGNGGINGGWLASDRPGIPGSDVPFLMAAPGLMLALPPLYAVKVSAGVMEQFARQFAPFRSDGGIPAFQPGEPSSREAPRAGGKGPRPVQSEQGPDAGARQRRA